MRDVLQIPFSEEEMIVIASDNSGGVGQKDADAVSVPYEVVSYYSFRTAVMECIAAGANPFAAILQNFCGENAWEALKAGIKKGLMELKIEDIEITGSTESNFALLQSAAGITVLGRKRKQEGGWGLAYTSQSAIGIIGSPLVGNEVVEQETEVAPLALFYKIATMDGVVTLPVGSKGILHELNQLFEHRCFQEKQVHTDLDLLKSSGPSTCFIVAYPREKASEVKSAAGRYFHEVNIDLE
ncbi:ATP-binding protein [Mesobacillus foraminis]|uniref:ATP-binding protein n=1 Tax=Mesobacillus foraminis TaxID=279826 RepID=UPI001BED1B73|nr:ATP-binding protein [Mesobacillus foraminis]MBT2758191.1 ATP-binding protein [Mesobacillus foraminis]